jgi:hypothetical protein
MQGFFCFRKFACKTGSSMGDASKTALWGLHGDGRLAGAVGPVNPDVWLAQITAKALLNAISPPPMAGPFCALWQNQGKTDSGQALGSGTEFDPS